MRRHRLDQLPRDAQHRVQRGHRVLEHHGDLGAADVANLRLRQMHHVLAAERIVPPAIRAGSSSSRMMDLAVTLLPDPDSPTMPSVSPGRRSKLTPSTARTMPASV